MYQFVTTTVPLVTDDDALLTGNEAAAYLGIEVKTLQKWRLTNRGPVFFRVAAGRTRVLYRRSDLDQWKAARAASVVKVEPARP